MHARKPHVQNGGELLGFFSPHGVNREVAYEVEIFMEKVLPRKQLYWLHTNMHMYFFPRPAKLLH